MHDLTAWRHRRDRLYHRTRSHNNRFSGRSAARPAAEPERWANCSTHGIAIMRESAR